METRLRTKNNEFLVDLPAEENAFWKGVGEYISGISIPNKLRVETSVGNAEFIIRQRGTYIENGQVFPSMFIVPEYNDISLPLQKSYEMRTVFSPVFTARATTISFTNFCRLTMEPGLPNMEESGLRQVNFTEKGASKRRMSLICSG